MNNNKVIKKFIARINLQINTHQYSILSYNQYRVLLHDLLQCAFLIAHIPGSEIPVMPKVDQLLVPYRILLGQTIHKQFIY